EVEELLPPKVTLSGPQDEKLKAPTIEVRAEAQGVGKHPITALQLLLDGRTYQGGKGLRTIAQARPGEKVSATWTGEVPLGEHSLRVLARSAVSTGYSNELEVDYVEPKARQKLHVLSIGINDYKNRDLKLHCAVKDALGLSSTFEE